jgi:site-specific recombinase XerD
MSQETLKDLLPKFIKDLQDKKRSPSTILAYRADLEQLVDFLVAKNKVLPEQIVNPDVEAFRDNLLNQKYTSKTVSRKLNAVKTFYRWLISEHLVTSNPAETVAHPKIEANMPKFLSPMEYRALRDVVREDIRIAAIIELVLQTGIRISEVANLKVEHLKDTEIFIESYATQSERLVPLNKPAKEALEKYKTLRPKTDSKHAFVSKNGKPLAVRNIRAAVDRFMQKAEMPQYSVNDLRTTFIIENLKAGVDLISLSKIVGHKRLSTTEHYLNLAKIKESGKRQSLEEL